MFLSLGSAPLLSENNQNAQVSFAKESFDRPSYIKHLNAMNQIANPTRVKFKVLWCAFGWFLSL